MVTTFTLTLITQNRVAPSPLFAARANLQQPRAKQELRADRVDRWSYRGLVFELFGRAVGFVGSGLCFLW